MPDWKDFASICYKPLPAFLTGFRNEDSGCTVLTIAQIGSANAVGLILARFKDLHLVVQKPLRPPLEELREMQKIGSIKVFFADPQYSSNSFKPFLIERTAMCLKMIRFSQAHT